MHTIVAPGTAGLRRSACGASAAEVVERLKLRRSTVEDDARRGVLPSIRLGRFRRFVAEDVEATLRTLRSPPLPSRRPS